MTLSRSEAETIALAIEGDELSQRRLYEEHHAAAYRLARLLLRDTHDAEEVIQDAFVYAFCNLERYDARRGSFWAWLRVILVSRCRNKRRRKRLPGVSLDVLKGMGLMPADPKPTNNPAHVLERSETRRIIWEALHRVSPGARDALILRYYEGLSYAEIAEALGCSNDAARSRVVHGKVQMRRLLTAGGGESEMEIDIAWLAEAGSR
jgi:RNA polymerase sigma-70 factor (ECF subfamily)